MGNKTEITFQGLTELLKAVEDCASDAEAIKTNKKIVKRSTAVVKAAMERKIPVSRDHSKSGREGSRPAGHARYNVPIEDMKTRGTEVSAEVGWKLSDTSEYFYMKFVNWGTTMQPPREFVHSAIDASEQEISKIAREEYENLLHEKIGD